MSVIAQIASRQAQITKLLKAGNGSQQKFNRQSAIIDIGFVMGTGRARHDTEEAVADALGMDGFSTVSLPGKVRGASDSKLQEILQIINSHQPGSLPAGWDNKRLSDSVHGMAWVKDATAGTLGYTDPASQLLDTNESEMSALFVVSTINEDRDGDIVIPRGCKLEAYTRNPAWFWNHQQNSNLDMPIGSAQDPQSKQICVYIEENRVLAKCWFDQGDPDAVFIFGKVVRGFIRATSIAFLPWEAEKRESRDRGDIVLPPGYIYKVWELTENTICGVGANSEAIRASLEKDPEAKHITRKLRKSLEACAECGKVWSPGAALEKDWGPKVIVSSGVRGTNVFVRSGTENSPSRLFERTFQDDDKAREYAARLQQRIDSGEIKSAGESPMSKKWGKTLAKRTPAKTPVNKENDESRAADEAAQPADEVTQALKSQEDCVSGKVPKLIEEGYSHDQSLAIAFHMCGEDKSESEDKPEDWDEAAKALGIKKKDKAMKPTKARDESDDYDPAKNPPDGAQDKPEGEKDDDYLTPEEQSAKAVPLGAQVMQALHQHHSEACAYLKEMIPQLEPDSHAKELAEEHLTHHGEKMDDLKLALKEHYDLDPTPSSEEEAKDDPNEHGEDGTVDEKTDNEASDKETQELIEEYRRGPDAKRLAAFNKLVAKHGPEKTVKLCVACGCKKSVKKDFVICDSRDMFWNGRDWVQAEFNAKVYATEQEAAKEAAKLGKGARVESKAVKGTIAKRLNKSHKSTIVDASDYLHDLSQDDSIPKRHKGGMCYHSERLASLCKDDVPDDDGDMDELNLKGKARKDDEDESEVPKSIADRLEKIWHRLPASFKN